MFISTFILIYNINKNNFLTSVIQIISSWNIKKTFHFFSLMLFHNFQQIYFFLMQMQVINNPISH